MEQLSREILLAQGEVYIKRETPHEADDKTKRRFLPSFAGRRYSRLSLVVRTGAEEEDQSHQQGFGWALDDDIYKELILGGN